MHPVFRLTLAALAAGSAACALAAPTYPAIDLSGLPAAQDEPWYRDCMRVAHASGAAQPTAQAPGPVTEAATLYYLKRGQAVTSNAEWDTVRKRALALGDNAVLMMLYANGFGVPRSADIAIHYACSMAFVAKAEIEQRVAHLAAAPAPGAVFDQCDDITSGMMGGICASIRETQDGRVRAARLARTSRQLPPAAQAAFKTLRAAADAYADAAALEVDRHGTGAAGFAIEHQARLREQFMQDVLDLLGEQPAAEQVPAPVSDPARLDADLNAVYQTLMRAPARQADWPDRLGDSTIDRTAVRKVERLWLAYRDAFTAFESTLARPPGAAPIAPRLTARRLAGLKDIATNL